MQVAFPVPLSSVSLDMRYWLTGLAVRQSTSSRSANNLNGYWRVATTELTRSAGLYGHVASTASSPRGYYYLRRPITTVVTHPVCYDRTACTIRLDLRRLVTRLHLDELIVQAQSRWKKAKDKRVEFKIGDKVWLEGRNLRSDRPSTKLAAKRYGPFKITKVLSPITYQIQLPLSWKIHDVFHVDLLTLYKETPMHGPNYLEPPPDLINGEEEYEVEAILDSRRWGRGRKQQYLVKWKGYSEADNQWVDARDIHADQLLDQFRKRLARRINTEPVHCRRTITHMSSNGSSTHSPDLFHLSLPTQDDVSKGKAEALAIAEAFKSWRPQVPSSWRTPSDSEDAGSSDDVHSDDGSPVLRRCFSVPQQLIPVQGGYQSLDAGRTPGEPLRPLIPTDDKPDQLCAPQHCPLPDSPVSSQSSFPAPSPVVLPNAHVV